MVAELFRGDPVSTLEVSQAIKQSYTATGKSLKIAADRGLIERSWVRVGQGSKLWFKRVPNNGLSRNKRRWMGCWITWLRIRTTCTMCSVWQAVRALAAVRSKEQKPDRLEAPSQRSPLACQTGQPHGRPVQPALQPPLADLLANTVKIQLPKSAPTPSEIRNSGLLLVSRWGIFERANSC